jgi:hypothetical protein
VAYLVAAVVLVGTVSVLNLLLTVGVIRRLRALRGQPGRTRGGGPGLLPPGATMMGFATRTVDGVPITAGTLASPTVVGLFSTECDLCRDEAPRFAALVERGDYPRDQVLAVVVGDPSATRPFLEALRERVQLVVEPVGGPVGAGFSAVTFPAFYLIDDTGTVRAAASDVEGLADAITGLGALSGGRAG